MEAVCSKCQNSCISQFRVNKSLRYHKVCNTCRPRKTNIIADRINYDKFNQLITDLHESLENNKHVLKVVGERN